MSAMDELGKRCLELEQELQYYRVRQRKEFGADGTDLSLYFDLGTGYTEEHKLHRPIMLLPFCHVEETFTLPEGVCALRLDPGELPCLISNLMIDAGRVHPVNGITLSQGSYLFSQADPMFQIESNHDWESETNLSISFDYRPLSAQRDAIERILSDELFAEQDRYNVLNAAYQEQNASFEAERDKAEALQREGERAYAEAQCWKERFEQEQAALQQIIHSRAWRISAPIRKLGALLRRKG